MLTSDQCYQAVISRDRRFDGRFVAAVRTTRIFCRPSCPAMTPKRENVEFFATAAAAAEAGFRACRRCRPEARPDSARWDTRDDIVARAVRLIRDGALDRGGVASLSAALDVSAEELDTLIHAELGTGPLGLARAEGVRTARSLIDATSMPMSEIALAAGFANTRDLDAAFREMYAMTPRQVHGAVGNRPMTDGLELRLAYRPPFDFAHLLDYFAVRAVHGIESVADGAYTRSMRLAHGPAVITVRQGAGDFVDCRLRLADVRDVGSAVARTRRTLDLDADPETVAETLGSAGLRGLVEQHPGIRSPGSSDSVELALRTVLGQQISLAAARTHLARLVAGAGEALPTELSVEGVDRLFPTAEAIAAVPDGDWALPASRIRTIRALSSAMADGSVDLGVGSSWDEASRNLLALPGIGPWSNGYIRMRALGDPDVFLGSDLGVKKAVAELDGTPEAGRDWSETVASSSPWRSYVTHLLWAHHADSLRTT